MESLYQNSVSEFDLNFFEPATNATQSTASGPCHESRKLGIVRLKDRLKGVSQVVHKAKKTNEILLGVQKELLVAKQELEETRNLLFDKNEEHKVICDERSVYFEQASKYYNEIQDLKQRMAHYEQIDYEAEIKEKVISGYSEQVKGLQLELENLEEEKKQCSRESALALKHAKIQKNQIENQIVKLLKHYVLPTISTKKRNRWLNSIIKQYVPELIKNDGEEKISKEEKTEETDFDEDLPLAAELIQQNISTDLDYVESVDTGRGSSLEYSDGEKSFHSPEYYMDDSPHCPVTNVCKKCNVPKCDVATSPITEELYVSVKSATKITCEKCVSLARTDSCTSPILSLMCDEATETSFETVFRKRPVKNVTHDACSENGEIIACPKEIEPTSRISPCHNTNNVAKKETVVMFAFDSDEEDDMAEDDNILDEECSTRMSASPADFNAVVNEGDTNSPSQDTQTKLQNKDNHDVIQTNNNAISFDESPEDIESNALEDRHAQIKIQITAASDNEDERSIDTYANRTPSPVDRSSIFTPIYDDASNCSTISSMICVTDKKLCSISTESKQILHKNKEKELLDINSNDSRADVDNDIEIQSILCKMRLHHQFITPIPRTPPRKTVQSPKVTREESHTLAPQIQKTSETMNEEIDSLRIQMQAVIKPFKQRFPQCVEQIARLYCSSKENEEFLRNLLFSENNKKVENKSSSTHEETWNNKQPDIVNLNSGSMLSITNEDYAHGPDELIILEEDMNVDNEEPTYSQNGTPPKKNIHIYKEKLPEIRKSNETNDIIPKPGQCDRKELVTQKNTQLWFGSEDESETNAIIQPNEDTITINSKDSLVYESAPDSDDECLQIYVAQNINESSDKNTKKKKGKARKLSKLDKLRNKMTPKTKILTDSPKSVKKPRFKPTPITPPAPKKTVLASDTAASLNDKTVYENAVKVLAAQKRQIEPRIVIEDCVQYPPEKKDYKNNNDKPGNKRKLSESETNPKLLNSNLNSKSSDLVATTEKRKSIHLNENHDKPTKEVRHESINVVIESQNIESDSKLKSPVLHNEKNKRKTSCTVINKHITPEKIRRKSNTVLSEDYVNTPKRLKRNSIKSDNVTTELDKCVKSPKATKQATLNKPDLVPGETKHTHEEEQSPAKWELTECKRKRTTSIKPSPIPKRKNSNNMEHDSPRVLRSSSVIKKKDVEPKSPVVFGGRELRSRVEHNKSEQKDASYLLPTGRRQRISRVKANTEQDSNSSISERKGERTRERVEKQVSETTQISSPSETQIVDATEKHVIAAQKPVTQGINNDDRIVSYADLDFLMDQDNITPEPTQAEENTTNDVNSRKDSLLCRSIEKYGVRTIKFANKTVPEIKINKLSDKLETKLSEIMELSHKDCKDAMRNLVADIRCWNVKMFIRAFINYLRNPERKLELFNKIVCPPAPPMTKKEQVLLYVIDELQKSLDYSNIVSKILVNIEYALFALNKPAEHYDVIESMAHFYALLCRSYHKLSKLRLFIIDAMYCLQMKAVILVQQCLEVWMQVLPLGHMGLATCPLVTCLVYLLHFYKCDDKFNRVREVRHTLRTKFNYDVADWSEGKILEHFRTAILEVKENSADRKILRLSFLVLAKRNGAPWCYNHIVQNMLQPLVDDVAAPKSAKTFALSLLGPLLKPYPASMKVHSETISHYLMNLLEKKNTSRTQEAIVSSLMCVDKNNSRFLRFLASWRPAQVSPEFGNIFKNYVRSKRLYVWKSILSNDI